MGDKVQDKLFMLLKIILFTWCCITLSSSSLFANYTFSSSEVGTEYCIKKIRNDDRLMVLDDMGVPIADYGYIQGEYVGPKRYPITISNIALAYYSLAANSNDTNLRTMRYFDAFTASPSNNSLYIFLANANWLRDNANSYGNYSVFDHTFTLPYPPYTIHPPWRSAMAQGLAIDVLSKAYNITSDTEYLDSAKKLLNAFFVDVKDGGVSYIPQDLDDGWWYELLANDQGIEPRILNGHMFALLGVYSYYNITHDPSAKFIFDKGILALKQNLPKYDAKDGYSYYDISKKLSQLFYHRVVVQQLQDLYDITKEPILMTYYDKWVDYDVPETIIRSLTCRQSSTSPVLVFKPSDSNLRIGSMNGYLKNKSTGDNSTNLPYYSIYKPKDFAGQNFSSQIINYRADDVTVNMLNGNLGENLQSMVTLNIEGIKQREYDIRIVFSSAVANQTYGWSSDHRVYTMKGEVGENTIVRPISIIGDDYLSIKTVDLYISNASLVEKVDYLIGLS
jgi:hypothetical protein